MKDTIAATIPETLVGLSIFLEECKKESNRIGKLERAALEQYKIKSTKDYQYKKVGEDYG